MNTDVQDLTTQQVEPTAPQDFFSIIGGTPRKHLLSGEILLTDVKKAMEAVV